MRVSTTCRINRYPQPIIIYSMIFKTFDSKIDKWTSKIGIFGKSFNELGTAINDAFKSTIDNLDNFDENVGFWESLKNSLFSKKADKNWIKNSLGDIISKENIDSYIEQLDLDTAKEKIVDIFNHETLVKQNKKSWQDYFDTLDVGESYIVDLIKNTDDLSKLTGEDLVKANQQARASALAHNEAIKAQTFSAKAGKVALQALAMAGNLLAMWGISKGLELAIKGIDELAHSAEHCKERVDELMSNYQSALDKANSNAKTIEDLAGRYEELSNGVNNLGENVSLTADEYLEYNNIVNQIAEMFPTLIQGYTNEGNAILSLKGNVEQLRDAYKEAQQEAYNMLIISGKDSDGNDIIKNWKNLHGTDFFSKLFDLGADDVGGNISTQEAIKQLEALSNMSAEAYRNIEKITSSGTREQIASLTDIEKEIGYGSFLYKALGIDGDVTDEAFAEARKQAQALIQTYQAEIDSGLNNVQTLANAYLMTNDDYDKLDEQSKTAASLLVNSIDEEIANGFSSKADVGAYVVSIVNRIKDNQEVQDALVSLLSLDTSEMSIEETQNEINKYIAIIADYLDENPVDLKLRLGVDIQQDKKELRDRLSHGGQDLIVDDWIDTLTVEEAKLANSTAFDEALERQKKGLDGAALSAENYSAALEEVKNNQNGLGNEAGNQPLSISQTIDQLNTRLKPTFESLKSAYQDIFTDDGFTLENVDLSMLDSIKSSIDELNKMEGVDINVDYSSFENLAKVLTDSSSTADDVKTAFNSLATEVLNATSATAGMTDETTNMVAELLESLGVTNAEEVAMYALSEAKAQAFLASYDLANATQAEITAMLAEGEAAGITTDMIFKLVAEEQVFNNQGLSVEGKVQELKKLAEAYGQTAVAAKIARMEEEYKKSHQPINYEEIAKAAQAEINNAVNSVHVDFSGLGKGAKSAGKKAGKDYKDALKEELSDLESVISGITGRIDDQISSVNEQKSAALESIDAQKEALEEAKDAAVEALEAERDARLEVIETQKEQLEEQIKLIDKQIKQKQDEIDAINEAAEARKRELDLQKAQYELERMQNQRTKLVYSSEKGMHYEADTSGIGDAKEAVDDAKRQIEIANIQKEIDLLEDQKDLLSEQITLLDEQADAVNKYYEEQISQTEKFYDQQLKNLEKQRKETESYFESITKNLENQKSKFQELTEILEKAELSAKLKQLGIDEEALLNGSEEEFNKLKDAYMNIVFQLNEGNDEVLNKLRELSGYEGTAPTMLEESNTKLGTMNDELGTANTEVGNVNSSLDKTASTTSDVATNVSDVNTNIGETVGLVNDEKGAFDELKQTIDLIVEAINKKIQAIEAGQSTVTTAVGSEMTNFQLLINKILEVKEKLDSVNDTVATMNRQPIDNLTSAFQLLYDKLLLVSNLLGVGVEGEGAVNGISGAIQALNEISLEEGIIAQFTNLKTAIDSVTAAISGGGGELSEGSSSGGTSGSKGGEHGGAGGKGSEGKGESGGGGNSLTGAIESMGETAKEVIGEPDAEGDGTVIGEFGSMETAVNDVRDAIGTEGSEGGEGGKSGSGGKGESDDTLVGSIINLGDTTQEEMGESDGDGILGKFNEFKGVIEEAANQVKSISEGLDEIDGKEVECSITVNVKMNGSIPAFASGTVLGNMQIESATYNAIYGKAFANGTIGLKHDEKNALRSEYGQPELTVYPNGTTELTTSPVMSDLPKGTVIYNEEETKKIMDNKSNPVGNAHADGTDDSIWTTLADGSRIRDLQPGDKMWDLYHAFDAYLKSIDGNLEKLVPNSFYEQNREWNKLADRISYANSVVNNNKNVQQPVIHGGINITCPGVTSKEVAQQVGVEVDRIFNGMHLEAEQRSRMR